MSFQQKSKDTKRSKDTHVANFIPGCDCPQLGVRSNVRTCRTGTTCMTIFYVSVYRIDIIRQREVKKVESASKINHKGLLIAPFGSTPKASKLLVVTIFSTRMTSRESITIRASASLKMILCLLSDPSSLFSRASNKMQS